MHCRRALHHFRRSFLNDDMRISATYTKRCHAGSPGGNVGTPIRELRVDVKGSRSEIYQRIRALKVQTWGNLPMFQGQHSLYQSRNAGGGIKMADVSLQRTNRTGTRLT